MFNVYRKRIILIFLAVFFLAVIAVALRIGLFLITPAQEGGTDQVIVVKEGLSLQGVADELERTNIITNRSLFMMWARAMGYSKKIKAGEYQLSPSMAPIRILEILTTGTIITHAVTIPEGFTNEQIAELLSRKGLVDKQRFLLLTDDQAILKRYGISGPNLEGYLYPDTYQFGRDTSAESIIDVMVKRFWEVAKPYEKRAEESGMKMKEVIILASIVEKETGLGKERPIIASVFLNRLKKRMRLESDPTVIYGIKNFNGNLTRRDLATRTPYNTYVIRGLPPGPIANPGHEAIKAVLYPANTNYLYFVSKNDGSHHFSRTLKEHNRAVIKYQKRRRTRYRKTS
jgi:UPF0755 protein